LLLVGDVAIRRATGSKGTGTFFGPKRPEK